MLDIEIFIMQQVSIGIIENLDDLNTAHFSERDHSKVNQSWTDWSHIS